SASPRSIHLMKTNFKHLSCRRPRYGLKRSTIRSRLVKPDPREEKSPLRDFSDTGWAPPLPRSKHYVTYATILYR
ncbi:hypothetical protein LTR93_012415, partial [Exophiala xenobiotica]